MKNEAIKEAMDEVILLAEDLDVFFESKNMSVPVCLAAMSMLMVTVALEEPELDVIELLEVTVERIKRGKDNG